VKQANPGSGQEKNVWYTTACTVSAAATKEWVKITKPMGGGWGCVSLRKMGVKMFEPQWPTKPYKDLLFTAFPEHVVTSLDHDLIQTYKARGA